MVDKLARMGNDYMKLSAKEAMELMPRGYIPTEQLFVKIKSIAEAGLNYIWSDLTLGQIDELQELGYKVERTTYDRKYKIEWK
jgi:hypothetical protein